MYFTSFLYLPCVKFIYDSHRNRKVMISYTRSVASFSTSCRPGWPRFPHILNIARMSSAYWPHQHFELLSFLADPTIHNTAISRKVVGKSARDNPERHCGWFWVLFFFQRKLKELVRKAMQMCLRVPKESNKIRFDSYSRQEPFTDHIPYYLSGLSRAHFFRQPFSK